MSVARSAPRSFFSKCLGAASHTQASRTATPPGPVSRCQHSFHTSAPRLARRRPRFSNVRAAEMGLVTPEAIDKFTNENFPRYTPEEKEALRRKYNKEQLAALEAAEAAVDPKDLTVQGRLRTDPYRLRYIDDFSTIQPVIDKRPKTARPADVDARFMNEDEFNDDLVRWLESFVPKDVDLQGLSDEQLKEAAEKYGPSDVDIMKYWFERHPLTGSGEVGNSALAPSLGTTVPGVTGLYKKQQDPEDEGLDEGGNYQDLKRKTGLKVQEIFRIATKVLVVRFVHNQTRLGKIRSSSVLAIAGNGNGRLGIGIAKSTEHQTAVAKAKIAAIRNMRPIVRYEDRTIYGNIEGKVSGTVVQLFARPPGFGLRVPHRIFEIARAVGISDLAAKIPRSRNPMNTVKATFDALVNQPNPDEIAVGRGKKLVDVRKVYYGGAVY